MDGASAAWSIPSAITGKSVARSMPEIPEILRGGESFYVIVGSSAGALTGLQFVAMTLIAEAPTGGRSEAVAAVGSTKVGHFGAAWLIAALLSAPWTNMTHAGWAVAATGAGGTLYCAIVLRR